MAKEKHQPGATGSGVAGDERVHLLRPNSAVPTTGVSFGCDQVALRLQTTQSVENRFDALVHRSDGVERIEVQVLVRVVAQLGTRQAHFRALRDAVLRTRTGEGSPLPQAKNKVSAVGTS